jgi:hypothetical protein
MSDAPETEQPLSIVASSDDDSVEDRVSKASECGPLEDRPFIALQRAARTRDNNCTQMR